MFNVLGEINWLAVALATVASAALGGVYFAVLVPKYYLIALGRQDVPEPERTVGSMLTPVLCVLVTTTTTAVLMRALDVTTVANALTLGLIVGVGYLTAMTFNIAHNPNFPRPVYYGLLNAPFFIVGSVIASLVLVSVR
jgi:amino acid transporter